MATFKAINVESDDDSDDEIDNTKEIQIEEALKIYQTALKFHASRQNLHEAGEAYKQLFESDIFKFPESQSEYARLAEFDSQQDTDSGFVDYSEEDALVVPAATENAPSTLSQILHLSFKNRAEYYLDVLRSQASPASHSTHDTDKRQETVELAQKALDDFTEALDKDEGDVEIWRRAARVGQALNSFRIAQYCLESALQSDEEGPDDVLSIPNFEAQFDAEALRAIRQHVEKNHDLSMPTKSRDGNYVEEVLLENKTLQKSLSLYDFLPRISSIPADARARSGKLEAAAQRLVIQAEEHTLDAVVDALLKHMRAQRNGLVPRSAGNVIQLELPTLGHDDPDRNRLTFQLAARGPEGSNHDRSSHGTSHTPSAESKGEKHPSETPVVPEMQDVQMSPTKPEPHRKRSLEVANIPENADSERAKSRRTRSRKSATGDRSAETGGLDLTPGGDPKHEIYLQADRWLFDLMRDVLRRMDVKMICNADDIRRIVSPNSPYGVGEGFRRIGLVRAMQDFYAGMLNWTAVKADVFTSTRAVRDHTEGKGDIGLLAFLDSTSGRSRKPTSPLLPDVHEFVDYVNKQFLTVEQAAVVMCQTLLSTRRPKNPGEEWQRPSSSPYVDRPWSDVTRQNVDEICCLVNEDLLHYTTMQLPLRQDDDASLSDAFEVAQSLFELHLDRYTRTISPTATTDPKMRVEQKIFADQWCQVSRELFATVIAQNTSQAPRERLENVLGQLNSTSQRQVYLRHLWATVFHLKAGDEISRDHLTRCIGDLKEQIRRSKPARILIHNNTTMPEISVDAADRELVKLDTMDFFLSIFNHSKQHSVDLIEKLEPILIPDTEAFGGHAFSEGKERRRDKKAQNAPQTQSRHEILSEFVKKADPSLRLTLWYKLRDSYSGIDFPTKVLFINFRILEVLMNELQSLSYIHADADERERVLLLRLKDIYEILRKICALVDGERAGLDCLDMPQLKSSAQTLVGLFTLLHSVTLYDDYSQALHKGPSLPNPFRAYPAESFFATSKLFHEMQLRVFILIYKMLSEAAVQLPARIPSAQANVDRYEYLQYVHYALGVRRLCKAEDNLFLHFMRAELLCLQGQPIVNDVAQILFDMYDLRCFTQASERQDHGCDADRLDRHTAIELIDFVLERTQGANIKDLPKADLGKSVEKLQNAIGPPTSTFATYRNRRILSAYLRSPVSPIELFQSLKGIRSLSTTVCPRHEAPIASKGWYFLIGMINLAKHKRSRDNDNSKVAEDVNVAVKYLTYDLEFDAEKWESWFRLGFGNDWLLEEQVLWQSDKLNSEEALRLQRTALHAYSQAAALAVQFADATDETRQKLAILYLEFAMRVYFSSRPPFSMLAFGLENSSEKLHSGLSSGGTYGKQLFQPLGQQQAMRIALSLCRRAVSFRASYWLNHLILGKCLWKMHQYVVCRGSADKDLAIDALGQFHRACEVLERRKDPNRTEPTLEPIYKIVFVVEKLVSKQTIAQSDGASRIIKALKAQRHIDSLRSIAELEESPSWSEFIIRVLKQIRQADRARWHHRVVYKIAQLIYAQLTPSPEAARQAKDFLEKNNMYSLKTAALSVWKPDVERPGRHWVYMTRYARFVSRLLEETADNEFMQIFARRVRRKTNEFFDHVTLWQDVLGAHLRLHRRSANVPEHAHTTVFADMNVEQFRPRAGAVDAWCCSPDTKHVLVDTLREIEDIKKINNKLVADNYIDELMCDTYAHIFATVGPTLSISEPPPALNTRLDTSAQPTPNTATPEPPSASTTVVASEKKGVMSLSSMMNVDGAIDVSGAGMGASNWRPITMPSNPPTATTFAITSAQSDVVPYRPRAPRSVTRRDVLKHAQDASITKVTAVKECIGEKDPKDAKTGTSDIKIVINPSACAAQGYEGGSKRTGEGDRDPSSELSDPDDNADDEMDAEGSGRFQDQEGSSTAKEEESSPPRPMFPGLKTRKATASRNPLAGDDKDGKERKTNMDRSRNTTSLSSPNLRRMSLAKNDMVQAEKRIEDTVAGDD